MERWDLMILKMRGSASHPVYESDPLTPPTGQLPVGGVIRFLG